MIAQPVQRGLNLPFPVGLSRFRQPEHPGQHGETVMQRVLGVRVQHQQRGVVVVMLPRILHRRPGLPDPAQPGDRMRSDSRARGLGPQQRRAQLFQIGVAAFEEGADGGVAEVDGAVGGAAGASLARFGFGAFAGAAPLGHLGRALDLRVPVQRIKLGLFRRRWIGFRKQQVRDACIGGGGKLRPPLPCINPYSGYIDRVGEFL